MSHEYNLSNADTTVSNVSPNDTLLKREQYEEYLAGAETISGYFYLFCALIGSPVNIYSMYQLFNNKVRCKREVKMLLLNLAIADTFVTLIHCVNESIWTFTNLWYGGDFLCRLLIFFRPFGCQVRILFFTFL